MYTHRVFNKTKNTVALSFSAGNKVFGNKTAGTPFRVYAMSPFENDPLRSWDYSVAAGDMLKDAWNLKDFSNGQYHLRVYAPNGFYREFAGNTQNPLLKITVHHEGARLNAARLTGNVVVTITNKDTKPHTLVLADNSYKSGSQHKTIAAGAQTAVILNLSKNHNWYDFSVKLKGNAIFEERFAGQVETGVVMKTDPLMGGIV